MIDPRVPTQWKQERPGWCPHINCGFIFREMDAACCGKLPQSERHDGDFNTHRFCLNGVADNGGVFDLQVNSSDLWWLRRLFDAIDGKRSAEIDKWGIDKSTGTPILIYDQCSVIQDEQAYLVMRALRAQLAQAEPVAWHRNTKGGYHEMIFEPARPEGEGWEPFYASPPQPAGWQPIETAPKGRKVLTGYFNKLGNWRTITARYYFPDTLESDHTESGFADEGWYEESDSIEEIMPTDCDPTHWMPLPQPPKKA